MANIMNVVILLLITDEYLEIIAVLWNCLQTLQRETETELTIHLNIKSMQNICAATIADDLLSIEVY
jgi:hypothetical protein